jgi:hypothetical protein
MGTVNEDEERNKALVIEAFDTLFHKRTMRRRNGSGRRR